MVSGLQLSEGKALGFMFSTGQVDSKATIQICFHWVKVDRTYKFIQLQGLILNNACKNVEFGCKNKTKDASSAKIFQVPWMC